MRRRDPIGEHQLCPIAAEFDWREQRTMWRRVVGMRVDTAISTSEKAPERSGAGRE